MRTGRRAVDLHITAQANVAVRADIAACVLLCCGIAALAGIKAVCAAIAGKCDCAARIGGGKRPINKEGTARLCCSGESASLTNDNTQKS